jgi:predicted transcriptional regulator
MAVASARKEKLFTNFTVRMSADDIAKLHTLAQQLDRSPSSVLRRLLRHAIPGGVEIAFASARACNGERGGDETDEA